MSQTIKEQPITKEWLLEQGFKKETYYYGDLFYLDDDMGISIDYSDMTISSADCFWCNDEHHENLMFENVKCTKENILKIMQISKLATQILIIKEEIHNAI